MKIFEKLGFHSIYHLNDGIMGWEEAGKPLQK
nr:rhodanese-like domain-containing protein [Verrucomicrobium spinosum]